MEYREIGKTGFSASVLGFGCMRLPNIDGDPGRIDEKEAIRMIRYAIDRGVNYFDSAYGYHRGTSEALLGKALKDGYREKCAVATKMPIWVLEKHEDLDRIFFEQKERTGLERFDFYLLHGLGKERWATVHELEVLEWAENKKAQGLIGHLGFSFHDTFEVFKEIIDGYGGWEFCQIQYNYMDTEVQAGTRGLRYAASKGLGVIVMEPIRGGSLAQSVPPAVQALWDSASRKRSAAEWALQWVWNHEDVSCVLSGMSDMRQVKENIRSAERSRPGVLNDDEIRLIERVRDQYRALRPIGCTSCEYCLPCPHGVRIPRNFEIYNEAVMYNMFGEGARRYGMMPDDERADRCVQCGECEPKCPQALAIPSLLAQVHERLEKSAG